MPNIDELYNLIDGYVKILDIVNPKKDISILLKFMKRLEPFREYNINILFSNIDTISKKSKEVSEKSSRINNILENNDLIVANTYRKILNNEIVTEEENKRIQCFDQNNPNIEKVLMSDQSQLYNEVSSIDIDSWSIHELIFLSYFYFGIEKIPKKSKKEILNYFLNTVYQRSYLNNMTKNYTETKQEEEH